MKSHNIRVSAWDSRWVCALLLLLLVPLSSSAQTTIEVNSASDAVSNDGICTLREAITSANGNTASGAMAGECPAGSVVATDTIAFNINGGGSAETIAPASVLPDITEAVVIDGLTQNCGGGPCIELDGTSAGVGQSGLEITSSGSTIRGLVINRFSSNAILINGAGATNNTIESNYLGTDLAGTSPSANNVGVGITGGATNNLIGGTTSAARNIISGNGNDGVIIFGAGVDSNRVEGNYIGTDVTGTAAIPNSSGINIRNDASDNVVGGTAAGAGNLISGNSASGLDIEHSGTSGNKIEGNFIGTDVTGTVSLPNREGIFFSLAANHNIVGGTTASARNVISGNTDEGVHIQGADTDSNRVEGNYIGVDVTGTVALANGGNGVEILLAAKDNNIGGTAAGAGNVISGNTSFGAAIRDSGTTGNRIEGNLIGTDATGTVAIPNGSYGASISFAASGNFIGGTAAGAGNVISGNTLGGIQLVNAGTSGNLIEGNLIGTDGAGTGSVANGEGVRITTSADSNFVGGTAPGAGNTVAFNTNDGVVLSSTAGTMNAILGNSIFSNGGLGIDLGDDGSSGNDGGDVDGGPNRTQNTPVIQPGPLLDPNTNMLSLTYLVDSNPANADYPLRVEFFIADGDMEEGQTFIGTDSYTAGDFAGGNKAIAFTPAAPVSQDDEILATATDSLGNTSEFSANLTVLPVELASFEGIVDGERVVLTWTTASEKDNAGFEIQLHERPEADEIDSPDRDGSNAWISLGFVDGAGTTIEPQHYRFKLQPLEPGVYGFRLKQIDFDGTFAYSASLEITVEVPRVLQLYPNYPNPFNPSTNLSFTVPSDGRAVLAVYSALGRHAMTLFDAHVTAGHVHRASLDASALATGSYFAVLTFKGRQRSASMLLVR